MHNTDNNITAPASTEEIPANLELILINISGQDRPGVTAALTAILAKYDAMILDIGQADIHHNLSLGILFRTTSDVSGDILKDLLFKAYDLGVKIRFSPRHRRGIQQLGQPPGKKPMDHNPVRPPTDSPPHRPCVRSRSRTGT